MSALAKRKWADFLIFCGCGFCVLAAGASLWAILPCLVLSCWNYYDGKTRAALESGAI